MKKNYTAVFSCRAIVLLFIAGIFCNTAAFCQQTIGATPNIDAGFENQSAGNLPVLNPNTSVTSWAYTSSGNGQIRTINSTGGNGGPRYLSVGKQAPTTNTSTTASSNIISTGTYLANTKYIVQFHQKLNTGSIDGPGSSVFISADGTSANRVSTALTTLAPTGTWAFFTTVVTTVATAQTTGGNCGIVVKKTGTADGTTSGVLDVDNFVVYPADNQTTPVPDASAPNPATGFTATSSPAVIDLNWTAPAGGVDGGGYMVVRFNADPLVEPDPVANAVYKANSSNTIGITGQVVYVGTANSFSDGTVNAGTNYWYRVYTVDKAFNYSTAVVTGPVSSLPKTNYYYDGSGPTDLLSNWWTNKNGTGTNPPNFTAAGQIFRIITNADLTAALAISGLGSALIIGDPSPGVNAMTIQFNSSTLPGIDSVYQSSNGLPTVLNFNTPTVPSINQLFDIFTEIHYRSPGITVSTSKNYDKIFVENNASVIFNGNPAVSTSFFVEAGSTATVGTLSTRWMEIKTGGTATINGKLIVPKLIGLETANVGSPSSAGGAIQFDGPGSVVLGPASTIAYSGVSSTTTQTVTIRPDYVNLILDSTGVSKTINGAMTISGTLTLNMTGATGGILTGGVLTVNGGLVLNNGKLNTDATNILVLGPNATVTANTGTSYIIGPMKRNTNTAAAYVFPVGNGALYRPVTVTPNSTTASVYQAQYINAAYSDIASITAPLTAVANNEYWDVTKISGSDAAVSLSLNGTAVPNAGALDELVVAHYIGSTWVSVSATPIGSGTSTTGTAVSTVLNSFSPFTFGIKPGAGPQTYYIDSVAGSDLNAGTIAAPWKNVSKINSIALSPGSQVFLKCGSTWSGQKLKFSGSGTALNPIIIDKYGTGAAPLLAGNGITGEAVVYLFNQQYIEIRNLEITNSPNGPVNGDYFIGQYQNGNNPLGADRRGVLVAIDNYGTANHIYLRNLNIHHIKGQLGSGTSAVNGAIPKRTGGILFTVLGNTEQTATKSRFNDILIDSCNINYCENIGLAFDNEWNVYYPGSTEYTDWYTRRFSNVKISNNIIHDIGKNAMIIRCTDSTGLIEKNVCYETAKGTTGNTMFTARAKGTVFQYNEGYYNRATTQTIEPGTADGSMYDPDFGSVGIIFQYSYSHDNSHGLYWGCNTRSSTNNTTGIPDAGDTGCIARYNISQNDLGDLVYLNYSSAGNEIYNNTFYIKPGTSPNIIHENSGNNHTYNFYNNIIYNSATSAGYAFGTGPATQTRTIQYNVFYGNHPASEPADPFKIISDPKLVSPGSGGLGINSNFGYKLYSTSPAVSTGKIINNNGGLDYFGTSLPATAPNRGAYEGSGPIAFTFNGNGNWDNAANWSNGIIPPATLTSPNQIIINPLVNGECIFNLLTPQHISIGSQFIINPGVKFRIIGNLIIN